MWITRAAWAQRRAERAALVQCARALAFRYAGCDPTELTEPEDIAARAAMDTAYRTLDVTDTRNLAPI